MKTPEEIMMDEKLMDKYLNGDSRMCWNYCEAVCNKLGKQNKYHEIIDETGWEVCYVIYGWNITWSKKVLDGMVTLNIENNLRMYVDDLRLKDKQGKLKYVVYIEGAGNVHRYEHRGRDIKRYDTLQEAKDGVQKFFNKEFVKMAESLEMVSA